MCLCFQMVWIVKEIIHIEHGSQGFQRGARWDFWFPWAFPQVQLGLGVTSLTIMGLLGQLTGNLYLWVCLKMVSSPLYPMVLLIIIPFFKWLLYFIGNINPTFSDKPLSLGSTNPLRPAVVPTSYNLFDALSEVLYMTRPKKTRGNSRAYPSSSFTS